MSDLCSKSKDSEESLKLGETLPKDDVVQHSAARAMCRGEHRPKQAEGEIPPKKRKTRRGKSKRRLPYHRNTRISKKSNKLIKPDAPHNSNQFLLEDHGLIEDLDKNLKSIDKVTTSTITRTRDSSFSVDSDGEFYSSPDDEEQFLIKDFDDQYESLQAERLQAMSKAELIEEYLMLESKSEQMMKRLQNEDKDDEIGDQRDLKREVERLTIENERLRREKERLQRENDKLVRANKSRDSDSEDSETDSSDSCSSSSATTSSCSSRSRSPISSIAYTHTNGHSSPSSVHPV